MPPRLELVGTQTRRPADPVLMHQGIAYRQLSVHGLIADSVLEFQLYLQPAPGRLVLFCGSGVTFTERQAARLTAMAESLWLRCGDEAAYDRYVERHLATLLAASTLGTAERASLVTSAARAAIAAAMADPRHGEVRTRTRLVAAEMVGLIAREPDAVHHMAALMERDYETVRHSINVSVFATGLAQAVGVSSIIDLQELGHGTLLHDIGKSVIPLELLTKRGKFTGEEFAVMQTHVVRGEELVEAQGGMSPLAMTALSQHHERLDGSGYPRRLPAGGQHLFGRITAICDVFDALTSERPYKVALKPADAIRLMTTQLAIQVDQELLRVFIQMLCAPSKTDSVAEPKSA
ncbi:MAG TPA: HD domain-containing phosphohydrolase [Luteitalea sp.]|nr:HD domain-containing phosphohydrolase [Luteitalea sp.]